MKLLLWLPLVGVGLVACSGASDTESDATPADMGVVGSPADQGQQPGGPDLGGGDGGLPDVGRTDGGVVRDAGSQADAGAGTPDLGFEPVALEPVEPNPITVVVTADEERRLTGIIEVATGGTVLTATQDGVLFELVVPPEALIADQEISIAPASVTGLPTAAEAVAAVDLQPDGLIFLKQAILRITVPSGLPSAPIDGALVGIGWSTEGADFHMRPLRMPSATVVEIPIEGFSGYGVVPATDSEIRRQMMMHPPENIGRWLAQEKVLSDAERQAAHDLLTRYEYASNWIAAATDENFIDQAIESFNDFLMFYELAPPLLQTYFKPNLDELRDRWITRMVLYWQEAEQRCSDHDLREIGRLVRISHLLLIRPRVAMFTPNTGTIRRTLDKCARFGVLFDSRFTIPTQGGSVRVGLEAEVDIEAVLNGPSIVLTGTDQSRYSVVDIPSPPDCSVLDTGRGDAFSILLDIGLNTSTTQNFNPSTSRVSMRVSVGEPEETFTVVCPMADPVTSTAKLWVANWLLFHGGKLSRGSFRLGNWSIGPAMNPLVASWSSSGRDQMTTESTTVQLWHEPDLP